MTWEEWKQRDAKSAVIVEWLVRVQLRAMGCEHFDIGIKCDAGEMILRKGQGAVEIEESIKWLRHEKARGAHIYVRPAGLHALSLIDDLSAEVIERMKAEGFEPALVVETLPDNFQAWLNHGQVLDAAASTLVAKALAERFGAIGQARTGGISGAWQDLPTRSVSASCPQECGRSPGSDQPPGTFTRKLANLSPALEQAAMAG